MLPQQLETLSAKGYNKIIYTCLQTQTDKNVKILRNHRYANIYGKKNKEYFEQNNLLNPVYLTYGNSTKQDEECYQTNYLVTALLRALTCQTLSKDPNGHRTKDYAPSQ